MSFSDLGETKIPTTVSHIEMRIYSVLDDEGVASERMVALAVVLDQDGERIDRPRADHTQLVDLGLMTANERDQLQAFVQNFRARVEALLVQS